MCQISRLAKPTQYQRTLGVSIQQKISRRVLQHAQQAMQALIELKTLSPSCVLPRCWWRTSCRLWRSCEGRRQTTTSTRQHRRSWTG